MNLSRKAAYLVIFALFILSGGTAGYMLLEGWPFFDSLYMTVITVYTVGYSELRGLSNAGRTFTMVLIVCGVGFFFYLGANLIQFMVEGRIRQVLGRRKLEKSIQKLQNHHIVCGYGRIGRVLCGRLADRHVKIVVIDRDEKHGARLDEDGYLYITGEATDEKVLLQAGIQRARGIVAALGTDTDNVFVALTAKQLNPGIFVMSRANDLSSVSKLHAAGADRVVSPYDIAGKRMAEGILRPAVTDFLEVTMSGEGEDIQMEEITMSSASSLAGVTLAESNIRRDLNLILIAIKKNDGAMLFNPSFDTRLYGGDTVIAVGAGIHGFVPEGVLASFMGKSAWWSVPLAVLLGIPMYSNAAGIIPIVSALLEKGAALGTVLAFMMSVIALSLPEIIILRKVLKPVLIGTFIGVVGLGILIVGYVFNLLL